METNLNTIHIFKTNITTIAPNCLAQIALDSHEEIQQWSIDCEDVDCVLRVVSQTMQPEAIISIITRIGHDCQELS